VAEAQKIGGMAAYIDVEHALDPAYAKKLGVDVDNFWCRSRLRRAGSGNYQRADHLRVD